MNPPRIALVTARAARGLDDDLQPLVTALANSGAEVAVIDWDDTKVDWSRFKVALLRSTWDYAERLPEFLAWAQHAAAQTKLLNPLDVLRWNTDKHYLGELAQADVPTVPSTFVEPGENAPTTLDAFLAVHAEATDFVVKPAIGAGSRDAQRYLRAQRDGAIDHVQRLLDARRSVLMQPYLDSVDEHGETALLFFDGIFSHAIRKGPLLKRGEGATRALFATEHITPRAPSTRELEVALHALNVMPFEQPLLYARVDLIRADDGTPRLLELELTEPSVFLVHDKPAAAHFTAAILHRAT
ncbi:MAG: hypothetical protein M3R20_07475 [Pseudomonadota bacterium]|nr:hypothetical protein [Pseudomonadota bacterium]